MLPILLLLNSVGGGGLGLGAAASTLTLSSGSRPAASLTSSSSSTSTSMSPSSPSIENSMNIGIYQISMPSKLDQALEFQTSVGIRDRTKTLPGVLKTSIDVKDLLQTHVVRNSTKPPKSRWDKNEVRTVNTEIACAMAHRNAYRKFLANETLTHALIFEDDVQVSVNAFNQIKKSGSTGGLMDVVRTLASTSTELGWGMLNLGRCNAFCALENNSKETNKKSIGPIRIVKGSGDCTTAYLLTRNGAQSLHEGTLPMFSPIDFMQKNVLGKAVLDITPRLFAQIQSNTNSMHNYDKPECRPHG